MPGSSTHRTYWARLGAIVQSGGLGVKEEVRSVLESAQVEGLDPASLYQEVLQRFPLAQPYPDVKPA